MAKETRSSTPDGMLRVLIERLVDDLFTPGTADGAKAERLVLWRDSDRRDLGGWGKEPLVHHIESFVAQFLNTPRSEDVEEILRLRRIVGSVIRSVIAYDDRPEKRSEPGPLSGPAWGRVAHMCGLGSTSAHALCREFGVHPETGVLIDE